MKIRALQIRGTGGGADIVSLLKAEKIIPSEEHQSLYNGTINFVLECCWSFSGTGHSGATSGVAKGTEYFLAPVKLFRKDCQQAMHGYIIRNISHPSEFNNVIEVVTQYIDDLRCKEHFEIEGPFTRTS